MRGEINLSIRYVIADSGGRYIMKNAANQYVPVYDVEFAEKYDTLTKAKNILNSCVNRSMRKLFSVKEIEIRDDSAECTKKHEQGSETPSISVKITYRPKQDQLRRLAAQEVGEEDFSFSKNNILNALGNVESVRERKAALQEQHSVIEKEIIDIEHYIELSEGVNAYQGWLAYMTLRKRLKLRRQVKDELMVLSDVEDVMNGLRKTVSKLNGLGGRKYEPRILTELFT